MNLLMPSGRGLTVRLSSHALPYAFGTHLLFGLVSVLNALELSFFYYYPRKVQITIVDPRIDSLIWGASIVCLSVLATWSWKGRRKCTLQAGLALLAIFLVAALLTDQGGRIPSEVIVYLLFTVATLELALLAVNSRPVLEQSTGTFLSRVLIYFLVYIVTIEVSTGTHYVLRSFDLSTKIGKIDAGTELQFSYAFYGLLPWLYLGFLFSWAWVPLVLRLLPRSGSFQLFQNTTPVTHQETPVQSTLYRRLSALLDYRFFVALAFAAFIGFYPYFQNPPWLVGTDAYWRYYDPLMRMNEQGVTGGFVQALGERHPLPLTLLYLAQLVFRTIAFEVVRLAPLFLVVGLGLSTWWFLARKKTLRFGLTVFMLSIMSVTTTVGMYSSILANWMALLVWMAYFAYTAFRSDEKFGILDFIVLLVMSTVILFLHPWTWGVFAAAVILVATATVVHDKRKGLHAAAILISTVVIGVLLAFLSISLLGGSQGWRILETLDYYTEVVRNPESVLVFWDVLTRLTQVWSPFFSPLYLTISILGVFYLYTRNLSPWRRRLILAWICASAVGSILVAPVGFDPSQPTESESQLWRLLFLTPFQLTAPFGIALISELREKPEIRSRNASYIKRGYRLISEVLLAFLFAVGIILAWMPIQGRILLILLVAPAITSLFDMKLDRREKEFLAEIVLAVFVLVAFNYATRSLSQLLIDPHNYKP